MQISLQNIEAFTEKYLENKLSENDKLLFEDAISRDKVLKKAFEQNRDAILAIELSGIKAELQSLFEKENAQKEGKVIKLNQWKKFIGIAASLLLLASLGYFFFLQKPNNEKLYVEFFYKDEGLPVTMGIAKNAKFAEAMNAYKADRFQKSSDQFKELLGEKQGNDTLQYYLAMSYLNQNQSKESIELLNQVIDRNQTAFRNEAEYFLALAYLKNNQIEKAKIILKYSKNSKSKELLEELE